MKIYEFPLSAEQCIDPAHIEKTIRDFKAAGWEYNSFVELRSGCVIRFAWEQKTPPVYPEGCEPVVEEAPAPKNAQDGMGKKSLFRRIFR